MPLPTKEQLEELKQRIEANRPQAVRVEPGTYRCRVISIDEKKSRKTALDMLSVNLRLIDLPGRPKIHKFVMTQGGGSFMYWDFLQALAYEGEDQQAETDSLLNRTCNVQLVDERQEDGTIKSVVKKFLKPEPQDGDPSNYSQHPEAVRAQAEAKAENDDLAYGDDAEDLAAQAEAAAQRAQALATKAAAVAAKKAASSNGESVSNGGTPAADPAPQESDHLSDSRKTLSHLAQRLKEARNA